MLTRICQAVGSPASISATFRSTISQTLTPDRMSSVFSLVVAGGPRFGDVESGTVAALASATFSVVSSDLPLPRLGQSDCRRVSGARRL